MQDSAVDQRSCPIYWDSFGLTNPNSGIFQYAVQLLKELQELGCSPSIVGEEAASLVRQRQLLSVPSIKQNCALPHTLRKLKPFSALLSQLAVKTDIIQNYANCSYVFHGLSNLNLPLFGRSKHAGYVLTVHDLIPLIGKDYVSYPQYLQTKLLLPRALKIADRIIAISNWTANALKERYPDVAPKIRVVRNGNLALNFKPPQRATDRLYLLTVGRGEAYKRIELVAQLVAAYPKEFSATVITDQVTKVRLARLYPSLCSNQQLVIQTNLTEIALKDAYASCDIYLHPSLYEGHALPPGEALAIGRPVVYTAGSGIDELCGHSVATPLARTASLDDWRGAVHTLYSATLADDWKNKLEKHFTTLHSWKECAKAVKLIYQEF